MGTATQSMTNETQRKQFDDLLKEALSPIDQNETEIAQITREIQLGRVFRDIVNKVIATDNSLAGVKPTLDTAVSKVVKPAVETRLREWIANGKKKEDWPFKDISTAPR